VDVNQTKIVYGVCVCGCVCHLADSAVCVAAPDVFPKVVLSSHCEHGTALRLLHEPLGLQHRG
jgi:hypothetical protein